jgi:hypothetical protein
MLLSRVSFEFTLYLNYAKNAIYKIRILFFIEEGLCFFIIYRKGLDCSDRKNSVRKKKEFTKFY